MKKMLPHFPTANTEVHSTNIFLNKCYVLGTRFYVGEQTSAFVYILMGNDHPVREKGV